MLLNWKNQESPSCAAMKEDTEWAVRQYDLISQYPEVPRHLYFRWLAEAGVVINDDALPALNQLANLATENILAGLGLSGQQLCTLDAIVRIEKYEVTPSGFLECILEPIVTGASAMFSAVANVVPAVGGIRQQVCTF
jgi:hypothetical protein